MTSPEQLACHLARARARTLRLVDFDDAELCCQYDPLMSPLVWDLAHIGQQEELWLLRGGDPGQPGLCRRRSRGLYDAFEHSRASRVELPLLSPARARSYCATVRSAALDALAALPEDGDSFVFAMVISHENQHDETMLQALNLRTGSPLLAATSALPAGRPRMAGTSVLVAGGPFVLGVDAADEPCSLDNERPAHVVDVPAFRIGRVPVTNGEWQDFIDDGGYTQSRWWSERGWQHRQRAGLTAPQFWRSGGRTRTRFGHVEDIPADEPVQHVSYFEAEAYAAWAGARLPTEVEWEKACAWDPATGSRRRYPWGTEEPTDTYANLGGQTLRPAPVGAYPAGASACGAEQMLGDVWEWTTSPLRPWPGSSRWSMSGTHSRSSAATTACYAAARGRWSRPSCGPASATGITRIAARSLPVSGWRGTSDVSSPGVARGTGRGFFVGAGPAAGSAGAVICAASAKHGLMNADGWGVGFFDGAIPRRWRSPAPLWGDTSFHSVAPALRSHCILAAVRSATVGMPIEVSATPPFTDGHWLLAHNGVVDRAVLPAGPAAESVCDSAILAATIFAHGLDALGDTIVKVGAADPNARLNILAANGSRLIATTWGDTLSILRRADGWCWPANHTTTTPVGATCRTATWWR